MLKRWQELAEPSFSSCLHTIPGVYTRAEILQGVKEENEDDVNTSDQEPEGKESISSSSFCSFKKNRHPFLFRSCIIQFRKIFT